MNNVIIFHGTGGTPNHFWFPYLKDNLPAEKFNVSIPKLPNPDKPDLKTGGPRVTFRLPHLLLFMTLVVWPQTASAITRDADGNRVFDNSAAHLEAELDKSLRRMGVEQVDLFYVHRRDPSLPIEEATENLGRLVQSGKAGAIGFSEIAPASLRRAEYRRDITVPMGTSSISAISL